VQQLPLAWIVSRIQGRHSCRFAVEHWHWDGEWLASLWHNDPQATKRKFETPEKKPRAQMEDCVEGGWLWWSALLEAPGKKHRAQMVVCFERGCLKAWTLEEDFGRMWGRKRLGREETLDV
jgi:hypothetical protein